MSKPSWIWPAVTASVVSACGYGQYVDRSVSMGSETELASVHDVPVAGHSVQIELRGADEEPWDDANSPVQTRSHGTQALRRRWSGECAVEGELLAIDEQTLWLFAEPPEADELTQPLLVSIPLKRVTAVEIEVHDSVSGTLGVITAVGTASTMSHGFFLILSAPTWLAFGIPSSLVDNSTGEIDVEPGQRAYLYQFARFPQGLPPMFRERPHLIAVCD